MRQRHGTSIPCGHAPILSRINVIMALARLHPASQRRPWDERKWDATPIFLESYHETLDSGIVWIAETTKTFIPSPPPSEAMSRSNNGYTMSDERVNSWPG